MLPRCRFSESHDFIATARPSPSTDRVSEGAMIPSSQLLGQGCQERELIRRADD